MAVHYRGAPEQVRSMVAESVDRAVAPWRRVLRIVPGKCVWEVAPRGLADKDRGAARVGRAALQGAAGVCGRRFFR